MISAEVIDAIGWAILHFVWQGLIIAAVTHCVARSINARFAEARYAIYCLGLTIMLAAPVVTSWYLFSQAESADLSIARGETKSLDDSRSRLGDESENQFGKRQNAGDSLALVASGSAKTEYSELPEATSDKEWNTKRSKFAGEFTSFFGTSVKTTERLLRPTIPYLIWCWVFGATLFAARLGVGCWDIRRIRISCQPIRFDNKDWLEQFERCRSRLGISRLVQLRCSTKIAVPAVIGWLRPIVVLPVSALSGLPPEQMEAVLAHELAHVKRADFAINFLQSLVEVLLFYHPAVWWISNQIRLERENCCDDLVTKEFASRKVYAETLMALAQLSETTGLAMSANGGDLSNRVRRMYSLNGSTQRSSLVPMGALFIFVVICIFAGWTNESLTIAKSMHSSVVEFQELAQDENANSIELVVSDEAGNPIKDVKLRVSVWRSEWADELQFPSMDYSTDRDGKVTAKLPDKFYIVRIWAYAEGYVPMFIHWEEAQIKSGIRPPAQYGFQLKKGTRIGGTIVNEGGQPIEGAQVVINATTSDRLDEHAEYSSRVGAMITGRDGRWESSVAPPGNLDISVAVEHTDYPAARFKIKTDDARKRVARSILKQGVRLTGLILDSDGFTQPEGKVVIGKHQIQTFPVEIDGSFETGYLPQEKVVVTVITGGNAPWTREIKAERDLKPIEIQLEPANKLVVKVVDENGVPIPNAYVQPDDWRNIQLYRFVNSMQTDGDGLSTWEAAPNDAVSYNISARGYMPKRGYPMVANGEVQKVVLTQPYFATGKIVDAETGQPINGALVVPSVVLRPDSSPNTGILSRDDTVRVNQNGEFEIDFDRDDCGWRLVFEAEGYETYKSELFFCEEIPESFQVKLKKAKSSMVTILSPDGQPSTDAVVFQATNGEFARGFNYHQVPADTLSFKTEGDGQVKLQRKSEAATVVAFSDSGYCESYLDENEEITSRRMKLQPWAKLAGTIPGFDSTRETIVLIRPYSSDSTRFISDDLQFSIAADSKGEFQIDRLPPMAARVEILTTNPTRPSYNRFDRVSFPVKLEPGTTTEIGGGKRIRLRGKFEFDEKIRDRVDLAKSSISIRSYEPQVPLPKRFRPFDLKSYRTVLKELESREDQRILANCFSSYSCNINRDGTISLDVWAPGKYEIRMTAVEKQQIGGGDVVGSYLVEHTSVLEVNGESSDDSNAFETIRVPALPEPAVGEVIPDFEFELPDGTRASISEYRGKRVLLDIWSSRSPVTTNRNQALNQLADQMKREAGTQVISLGSSSSGNHSRVFRDSAGIIQGKWIRGEGNSRKLGLWRFPKYFLLDKDGKILEIGT